MLALVKYGVHPGEVDLIQIDEPACGPHDVKIEIKASAICATDLHILSGHYPWPAGLTLGHEFCGVIVEKGASVKRFSVGQRVVACMDGGFAKYVVKNEADWVFALPDEISYEEGALLEPFCAAAHSVINQEQLLPNDVVLVQGPGVLGLCVLQMAKLRGAKVIISGMSSDHSRLALARALGADRTVDIQNEDLSSIVAMETAGRGADFAYECVGRQEALDSAIQQLRTGGTLVQIGIFESLPKVDLTHVVYHSKTIVGSIGYSRETWERCIALVRERKVLLQCFCATKLSLNEWKKGFEMTSRKEDLRVILVP